MQTSLVIMATRCAKRQVAIDSSSWEPSELMVASIAVLQLPPRLSFSIAVSMLLRYGTCGRVSMPCPVLRSCWWHEWLHLEGGNSSLSASTCAFLTSFAVYSKLKPWHIGGGQHQSTPAKQ
jgi:hypothetical protein